MMWLLAVAALAWASAAQAAPSVWTIRDEDSRITLFGSMHALPPGVSWRTPELDAAIAGADEIWFEAPVAGEPPWGALHPLLYAGPGADLCAALTAERRAWLDQADGGRGCAGYGAYRPWYVASLLDQAYYERAGWRRELGVEAIVQGAAPPTAKLRAFDDWPAIARLEADASPAAQQARLEQSIDAFRLGVSDLTRALTAWTAGDQAAVAKLSENFRTCCAELHERMVAARNRAWTERIAAMLAGHGDVLIVVGAGHLAGPEGVPALLRARGVVVEGP